MTYNVFSRSLSLAQSINKSDNSYRPTYLLTLFFSVYSATAYRDENEKICAEKTHAADFTLHFSSSPLLSQAQDNKVCR